ncbi:hypothetical protein A2473_01170 [candidate division WWE3 bacterium RIFOXYC2_FULL_42_13]|uniref:Glycosyltransferase RgtA/B/C/D-like domain-containing protein n=1 Tax=candidate division WWE3 bacterium TaxID=2053526 RepID=A0A3D0ZQB4_UNCKA|nr:MAG: hypothetical protein A2245_02710 [candidate division WWE3 bacterium RIFOXYA2_FULL_43_12]OGC65458.1 MAG: hypothetical protein A2274_02180 [candidate division WWE3 bacterium RIFOXYA12_FULL_43_11]OGC74203.1 MAG: hypothetical protein A2473_01170 [candidate division WWE3 bacterium RIFOXYC2_FULL_42_13]OGC75423.1 MAG: hypothetical protein A2547_02630 [candidate division WWE3 bacterium RIFOXYD2_FULL_43_10]HBY10087.1 hypothetical protein [candidate division WWE3 bacterium]
MFFKPLIFDENVYFYYAWLLKTGEKFYSEGWFDDKGPLIYVIYLLSLLTKSNYTNVFVLKIYTLIYQYITILVFYRLSKMIFYKKGPVCNILITVSFILLYTSSVFEGQYSNADNFILLPILLAILVFLKNKYNLSSLFIGISFLIKQNTALLVLPFIGLVTIEKLLIKDIQFNRRIFCIAKIYFTMFLSFLAPLSIFLIYMQIIGNQGAFLNNFLLDRIQSHLTFFNYEFFLRYYVPIVKQTYLFWIFSSLNVVSLYFYKSLKSRERYLHIFVVMWFLSSLVSVIPGGNFFPHYFIVLLPALVISTYSFLFKITDKRDLHFPILLIFFLFFAQEKTIFDQLVLLSKNVNTYVTPYDNAVLKTAEYLQENNAEGVFVYDYGPNIYTYSQVTPVFNYPFKFLYIDYSKVSSLGIYSTIKGEEEKQLLLKDLTRKSQIEWVVISAYDSVSDKEIAQLEFLNDILTNYEVAQTFDRMWIYKRSQTNDNKHTNNYSSATVQTKDGYHIIKIARSTLLPDVDVFLTCNGDTWHFPENGIEYPMEASQNATQLVLTARKRSENTAGEDCKIVSKSMSGKILEGAFKL